MKSETIGTITIVVPERNAMYCHYPRQSAAQDSYIELSPESRTLCASYDGEIGNAVPAGVYHGRDRRYGCVTLSDDAALELMREIAPLAERVCDGFEVVWNGNNNVGKLNDEARDAEDEIIARLDNLDDDDALQVWGADEWLGATTYRLDEYGNSVRITKMPTTSIVVDDVGTITANTTDRDIYNMVMIINEMADSEGIVLDHPTAQKYLESLREECEPAGRRESNPEEKGKRP